MRHFCALTTLDDREAVIKEAAVRTATSGEPSAVEGAFASDSFSKAVLDLRNALDFRALAQRAAINDLLLVLALPGTFEDLRLGTADGILVKHEGRNLLRLRRKGCSGTGQTVCFTLEDVEAVAAEMLCASRKFALVGRAALGLAALVVFAVANARN